MQHVFVGVLSDRAKLVGPGEQQEEGAGKVNAEKSSVAKRPPMKRSVKRGIWIGLVVVLVAAMALSTKIVPQHVAAAAGPQAFDPAAYGADEFPKIQSYIHDNATEAVTLATAMNDDMNAAQTKYGRSVYGSSYTFAVSFTGVVGEVAENGYTPVTISGMPDGIAVAVQLGPAIYGTDLRDVTGDVTLDQFTDQIAFQNAGVAINNELKAELGKIDVANLKGKTIKVEGAFTPILATTWNVTPATVTVEG